MYIKWPNDIYYQAKVKLGGILVSCFSIGRSAALTAVVGENYFILNIITLCGNTGQRKNFEGENFRVSVYTK